MYDWTDDFMDQLKYSYPKFKLYEPNGVDDYMAIERIIDDIMRFDVKGNA